MKPHTLFFVLVFLLLWGADEALASSWLSHSRQPSPATQEVFPLALRYRAQILDQSIPKIVPLLAGDLLALRVLNGGPNPGPEGTGHQPAGRTLLYLLMSLQC